MTTNVIFDRLSQFCRAPECADFFKMAQESFWEDLIELTDIEDLDVMRDMLPPYLWSLAEINLTAFFVSNDYQESPDPHDPRWNAVQFFMSENAKQLRADEKHFLTALRQSHMSVYRIMGLDAESGIKLWDMIDGINVTACVDPELYALLKVKETWGMRLIKTDNGPHIMNGSLPLKENAAKTQAAGLKKIHTKLMRRIKEPEAMEELGRTSAREVEHLARVMWAPEIATASISGELARIGRAYTENKTLSSQQH
jgi:hypothetical protein